MPNNPEDRYNIDENVKTVADLLSLIPELALLCNYHLAAGLESLSPEMKHHISEVLNDRSLSISWRLLTVAAFLNSWNTNGRRLTGVVNWNVRERLQKE